MVVSIILAFLCIIMLNYRINKLEEEIESLDIRMKIMNRTIEYLCYLVPEPKEGQLKYCEYMDKYYGEPKEE